MKCKCVLILILQVCGFLHALTEVQKLPVQDDIHVTAGMQVILRFRLLAADLSQYDIKYKINNTITRIPNQLDFDSSSSTPYSATVLNCEEEGSARDCRDLVILVTGSPDIHAHTFTPEFVNAANHFFRERVETDKLFRIHYQDGSTTPPPTTEEPTEPDTTQPPPSSTANPTSSTPSQGSSSTSSPAIDLAMNKDSLEDVSTIDYVMFAALFSLAITVAVSLFINIILCFKLKRQNQELKHYGNNAELV